MDVEVIRAREELCDLVEEWNELLGNSDSNTIFLTWEWISSWLEAQSWAPSLFVIVVRDADRKLTGIAPFYKVDYRLANTISLTALRVIGDQASGAEYGNVITTSDDKNLTLEAVKETLLSHQNEWDFLWVPNMPAWDHGALSGIGAVATRPLAYRRRQSAFSALQLPQDFDEFLLQMSANRRQQLRRTSRRILDNSDTCCEELDNVDLLPDGLNELFRLHNLRWQNRDESGSFLKRPALQRFYESFAPKALARGWLRMYFLKEKDNAIAVQYGYRYGDTFFQLQEGFDPNESSGAGTALRSWVIRKNIEEGAKEYDFLGGHNEHKRRWNSIERTGADVLITHSGAWSRVINLSGLWPTGRYLRPADNRCDI